jgi:hypothetical protein
MFLIEEHIKIGWHKKCSSLNYNEISIELAGGMFRNYGHENHRYLLLKGTFLQSSWSSTLSSILLVIQRNAQPKRIICFHDQIYFLAHILLT